LKFYCSEKWQGFSRKNLTFRFSTKISSKLYFPKTQKIKKSNFHMATLKSRNEQFWIFLFEGFKLSTALSTFEICGPRTSATMGSLNSYFGQIQARFTKKSMLYGTDDCFCGFKFSLPNFFLIFKDHCNEYRKVEYSLKKPCNFSQKNNLQNQKKIQITNSCGFAIL
jgi:hypothetical protein